jgi:hypothetical protein
MKSEEVNLIDAESRMVVTRKETAGKLTYLEGGKVIERDSQKL